MFASIDGFEWGWEKGAFSLDHTHKEEPFHRSKSFSQLILIQRKKTMK